MASIKIKVWRSNKHLTCDTIVRLLTSSVITYPSHEVPFCAILLPVISLNQICDITKNHQLQLSSSLVATPCGKNVPWEGRQGIVHFVMSSLQNMADQNKQKTCMYFRENKKSDVEILSSSTEPNHTWSIIVTKVRTSELRVGWEKCFITGYSLKKHWKSKANWVI